MNKPTYDFSGFATKYGIRCEDGRTIGDGAFAHQNKVTVPLVWQHGHDSVSNVLGHGVLLSDEHGMRIQAVFNDTQNGKDAKTMVVNRDIRHLSVYANKLTQVGGLVKHGQIREVSLVLGGSNPGALIDDVIVHGSGPFEDDEVEVDSIIIHTGLEFELYHATDDTKNTSKTSSKSNDDLTAEGVMYSLNKEQADLFAVLVHRASTGETNGPGEPNTDTNGKYMKEVYASLNTEQEVVFNYLIGSIESPEETGSDSEMEQGVTMTDTQETYNVFENGGDGQQAIIHQTNELLGDAIRGKTGSLSDFYLQHDITNVDDLFPDAKNVESGGPRIYDDNQEWVSTVLGAVYRTPFSRIKSRYSDMTPDEARAKGYVTGDQKLENVYIVSSRTTLPQTIYTKQQMDRDDIIDITEFSVVNWIKATMRAKLREETALAVLIGDGRNVIDADKIQETNVRPIVSDDAFYAHPIAFALGTAPLDKIDGITASRSAYRGSGNPTFYCSPTVLSNLLLVRDTTGRRIYKSVQELASSMRVRTVVEVPAMENFTMTDGSMLEGISVNLRDYTIGADSGGRTTFFDDFDIDFNTYKYLLETRISGALTVPKSAIVYTTATVVAAAAATVAAVKTEKTLPDGKQGDKK